MLIRDAKKSGLIPEEWHNVFRDNCDCGSPLFITDNRKTFGCTNPRCVYKMQAASAVMLQNFDVKGIGSEFCLQLLRRINVLKDRQMSEFKSDVTNYLINTSDDLDSIVKRVSDKLNNVYPIKDSMIIPLICNVDDYMYVRDGSSTVEYYNVQDILTRKMTVADAIGKLSLPSIGKETASKLFRKYTSYSEMEHDIVESGSVYNWIYKLNGCTGSTEVSNYVSTFNEFNPEIKWVIEHFNIIKGSEECLKICITGEVMVDGAYVNRKKFLDILKDASSGVMAIEESQAFNSLSYVVADYPSSSRKYREGVARGIIITAQTLLDSLRKLNSKEGN